MSGPITIAHAKKHLKIEGDDEDGTVDELLESAVSIVADYVKDPDQAWTEATVPPPIRSAIKLALSDLYAHRGDGGGQGGLTDSVKNLLVGYRDPTLA